MEDEGGEGDEDRGKEGEEETGVGDDDAGEGEDSGDEDCAQRAFHRVVGETVEVPEH